jgi:hypothetical protein
MYSMGPIKLGSLWHSHPQKSCVCKTIDRLAGANVLASAINALTHQCKICKYEDLQLAILSLINFKFDQFNSH